MEGMMPQAMVIAGNASRFADDVHDFQRYLVRDVGIGPKSVRDNRTAYLDEDILGAYLAMAIEQKTKTPLVILYCGHGSKTGWALDDAREFSYRRLAEALKVGRRPVLLVNDCCHAMAAAAEFEKQSVSPERVSLIAASEVGETTTGGLVRLVLNGWRQNRPTRFGPELRWGARHDQFFFPKPPAAGDSPGV
jgi:hypothetical protein